MTLLMDHIYRNIINVLTFLKIVEQTDDRRKLRFMRRSLFYLPLLSIFIATAIRLFYIVYRLGDLSNCNLKINEIIYDSRNVDLIFLDFNIDGCSLPANCEFIKSKISLVRESECLISVDIATFEIKKNTPIRVKCPVKINEIGLSCFIDPIKSSQLRLEFVLYIKVRFLLVSIPICFKSEVKCSSSNCNMPKLVFGFYNYKILGKLDNVRIRSQLTLRNIPEFINIKHSKIIVESEVFKIHLSPIIIRKGCLYKSVEVELQLLLNNKKATNELINALINKKQIQSTIDRINHCILEQMFKGLVVAFDNTESQLPRIFLFDKKINKVIYTYEFDDSYFDMLGVKKDLKIKSNYYVELIERPKPENENINEIILKTDSTTESLCVLYAIKPVLNEGYISKINEFIELIGINTSPGYVFITFKINLERFYYFTALTFDDSLVYLEVNLNCQQFIVPVIISIKAYYMFITVIINEDQFGKLLRAFKSFNSCRISVVGNLCEFYLVVKYYTLELYNDKGVFYSKDFSSFQNKSTYLSFIHKLVKNNAKEIIIVSTLCKEDFSELNNYFSTKNLQFNLKVKTRKLLIGIDLDLKPDIKYSIEEKNTVLIATSSIEINNIDDQINGDPFNYLFDDGEFQVILNNNFHLHLNFHDFFNINNDYKCYRLPRINFKEVDDKSKVFSFCGTIEKEEIGDIKFCNWTFKNIFQIGTINMIALQKNIPSLEIGIMDLEISFIVLQDNLFFYLSNDCLFYVNFCTKFIDLDILEFDNNNNLFAKLIFAYLQPDTNNDNFKQLYFSKDSVLNFDLEVGAINNSSHVEINLKISSEKCSPLRHKFSFLEKSIKIYKNLICYKFEIRKKQKISTPPNLISLECIIYSDTRYNFLQNAYVLEIFDHDVNVLVRLKQPEKHFTMESKRYGHVHLENIMVKQVLTFIELDFEGFVTDCFLSDTISKRLLQLCSILLDGNIPEYIIFIIRLVQIPVILPVEKTKKTSKVVIKDSCILYEINLKECYQKISQVNAIKNNVEFISQSLENGQLSLRTEEISLTVEDSIFMCKSVSTIYFLFKVSITTYNSEIIVNIPNSKFHPIFTLFCNSQNRANSLFKLRFISKQLFMLTLHFKFKMTFKEFDSVFMEIHEGHKAFLQLLLNPKISNPLFDDFYILGFTSFYVLYHDYGFLVKRLFQFPLTVDIKRKDNFIVRSQVVYEISYLLNLAFIPIGLVDTFIYSSSAFNLYKVFREWGILDLHTDELYCFDEETLDSINSKIMLFKSNL